MRSLRELISRKCASQLREEFLLCHSILLDLVTRRRYAGSSREPNQLLTPRQNWIMTREEATQHLVRSMSPAEQLIAALQYHEEILWEPDPAEGRKEGWAACGCGCGRRVFISLPTETSS